MGRWTVKTYPFFTGPLCVPVIRGAHESTGAMQQLKFRIRTCCLSLSYMIVKQIWEDVTFFHYFSTFKDKTTSRLLEKIITTLIDNDNNC